MIRQRGNTAERRIIGQKADYIGQRLVQHFGGASIVQPVKDGEGFGATQVAHRPDNLCRMPPGQSRRQPQVTPIAERLSERVAKCFGQFLGRIVFHEVQETPS